MSTPEGMSFLAIRRGQVRYRRMSPTIHRWLWRHLWRSCLPGYRWGLVVIIDDLLGSLLLCICHDVNFSGEGGQTMISPREIELFRRG